MVLSMVLKTGPDRPVQPWTGIVSGPVLWKNRKFRKIGQKPEIGGSTIIIANRSDWTGFGCIGCSGRKKKISREKRRRRKTSRRKKVIECADSGFFGSISKKEEKKTRDLFYLWFSSRALQIKKSSRALLLLSLCLFCSSNQKKLHVKAIFKHSTFSFHFIFQLDNNPFF